MPWKNDRERPQRERRLYAIHDLEIRAATESGAIPMSGYAALFNSRSNVIYDVWMGAFREEIEPGAFTKTLADGADVRLLINHDPNLVLARTRPGTLRLVQDDTGLKVDADMAPTTYAQDLAISLRRGDVSQMSFAFRVVKDVWNEAEDGMPLRRIQEAALLDTAVVTYPAYEETAAGLRSQQFARFEDADAFIMDLITREITPASLPVLRAARSVLAERLAAIEPDENHSIAIPLAIHQRRHALKQRQMIGTNR